VLRIEKLKITNEDSEKIMIFLLAFGYITAISIPRITAILLFLAHPNIP
jgi:hypothetical protein